MKCSDLEKTSNTYLPNGFSDSGSFIYPADFEPTKGGYRKYLKALGVTNYDGIHSPFFAISLEQFKHVERPALDLKRLDAELETINAKWYEALILGQDDSDPRTDAFHLKKNALRVVRQMEVLEKKDFLS